MVKHLSMPEVKAISLINCFAKVALAVNMSDRKLAEIQKLPFVVKKSENIQSVIT